MQHYLELGYVSISIMNMMSSFSNCIKKALHLQTVSIEYSTTSFYAYVWSSGLMILVKEKCMASLGCVLVVQKRPSTFRILLSYQDIENEEWLIVTMFE